MREFATRYNTYSSTLSKSLRLIILIGLLVGVGVVYKSEVGLRICLALLSFFIINEVFFFFFIRKQHPRFDISAKAADKTTEMTFQASQAAVRSTSQKMVQTLLTQIPTQKLLGKLGLSSKDIVLTPVDSSVLFQKAEDIASACKGIHITSVDLMGAYLLLTEPQTKLLLQKKVLETDFMIILSWLRDWNRNEEYPQPVRVKTWGQGIAEDWVSGWTIETKNYTQDFTQYSLRGRQSVAGREKEYQQLQEILTKTESNNALIVGDIGVGKETLVSALSYDSEVGVLPKRLRHKKILEVLVSSLMAGAQSKGELEARLQAIVEEVSHAGNIILYVPEFQDILGASSYNLDISGALLPYLQKGELPIIATITVGNYKKYIEQNPLRSVFDTITLTPPSEAEAIPMILAKSEEIEQKLGITIPYTAVVTAVKYAGRYRLDDVLPGGAAILLEDAASVAVGQKQSMLTEEMVLAKIEEVTHTKVGSPDTKEKETLLHLEEFLHQRVVGQELAVSSISEALRRLRSGVTSQDRPISFLFLGPTGVGKTETARALADIYFQGQMIRIDMSEYADASAVTKLIGAPFGDQRGELTEQIHDKPFSLVLLDEFEKASADILNIFLQVLDDGRLTDGKGKTVSFANAIVIATSNAGSEFIREYISSGKPVDATFQTSLLNLLQTKGLFKPELLNRFDGIVAYRPLTPLEIEKVATLLLAQTTKRLADQDISVRFDGKVVEKIAQEGFDKEFGARPLRRFIEGNIEDMIAKKMLSGEIVRGDTITVTLTQNQDLTIVK